MFIKKLIPATLVCAVSGGVVAQESEPADAEAGAQEAIPEVQVVERYLSLEKVNAVKTPTPIINVPQSLSIITSEDIQVQGIK